jgi:hypothetical protein
MVLPGRPVIAPLTLDWVPERGLEELKALEIYIHLRQGARRKMKLCGPRSSI